MMTRSHYGRPRRVWRGVFGTSALIVILIGVFAVSVYWFRQKGGRSPATVEEALAPTSAAAVSTVLDLQSTEATLQDVSGGSASGQATRGTRDGRYYHTVKTPLPMIDREEFFYEGWLVRPMPFDYFSTGEMVTNNLGEFILEWDGEAEKDYRAYTQVVITLEAKDGNPDPAKHILEGEFGN